MSTKDHSNPHSRIEPEPDASGSYPLEYAYQGAESPSDSMEPKEPDRLEAIAEKADQLAAQLREDRPERYQMKHAQQVTT